MKRPARTPQPSGAYERPKRKTVAADRAAAHGDPPQEATPAVPIAITAGQGTGTAGAPAEVIDGDPAESGSFPLQWRYITSDAIRNVCKCSRRSGKTEGEIRRAARFVLRGKRVLYIGRVLRNVRQQFWVPFKDSLASRAIVFKTNEQDLTLRHEAGGVLMAMSADDLRDIEKGRGYKWDLVMIDEAQSFADEVIEPLIDMILIPTLIDGGGSLDMAGTPPDPTKGDSMNGYFVRVIKEAQRNPNADPKVGWRMHEWTMYENPFIQRENIAEAYAARGIGPGHPIWEAEVLGKLVYNPAHRVFPFDVARNGYTELPR